VMNRRTFVASVTAVLAPFAGEAQQVKVYRVGVLNQGSPAASRPSVTVFMLSNTQAHGTPPHLAEEGVPHFRNVPRTMREIVRGSGFSVDCEGEFRGTIRPTGPRGRAVKRSALPLSPTPS
jgi:hypothetical protein